MDADTSCDPHFTTQSHPAAQLQLIDSRVTPEWRLDETTRAIGRRGIEQARHALHAGRRSSGTGGRDSDQAHGPGESTAA
jgi:hypothetical protein